MFRLLMVGLDGSGKTTILYKLKSGGTVTTIPTLGYNDEIIEYKNNSFEIWDIGGLDTIRALWFFYLQDKHGIIYVVDSSDPERIVEAEKELAKLLKRDELKDALLLVYANKQDISNALTKEEIANALKLNELTNRKWHIQATCATQEQGIHEGLDWILNELAEKTDTIELQFN